MWALGRGRRRVQGNFLFPWEERGGKHSAWLRANLLRELDLEAIGMSLPHQLVHPCLFGGRLLTPTGWVGGPGSLSLLFLCPSQPGEGSGQLWPPILRELYFFSLPWSQAQSYFCSVHMRETPSTYPVDVQELSEARNLPVPGRS